MPRVVRFIETESRMVIATAGWEGGRSFIGRVLVSEAEKSSGSLRTRM